MSKGYLKVTLEGHDLVMRVCPSCLAPLTWYEYRTPTKRAVPEGIQSTEEKARCPNHGWVDWWRIVSKESGRVIGFSTFLRGGRLHSKAIKRETVLAHAERALVPFHYTQGERKAGRRLGRDKLKKLRNRFRGYLVEDVRQGSLF